MSVLERLKALATEGEPMSLIPIGRREAAELLAMLDGRPRIADRDGFHAALSAVFASARLAGLTERVTISFEDEAAPREEARVHDDSAAMLSAIFGTSDALGVTRDVPASAKVNAVMAATHQARVVDWLAEAFGADTVHDQRERGLRFVEEAIELVQATGLMRRDVAEALVRVYNRPAGDVRQEVGGVSITLTALCHAFGIYYLRAAEAELARAWRDIDAIRMKEATRRRRAGAST